MKHSWKRAAAVAALVLTAGFGLSACGDDDDTSSGGERGTTGNDAALTKANFTGRVMDAQADVGSSRFEFTMDAMGMEMTGSGALAVAEDADETAMSMTMSSEMGDMEFVIVDGTMYMNMGPMTQGKFIVMELDSIMGEEYATMLDQMNPTAQFEMFEDAVVEFEQDGEPETIDGVEATPYLLVLDTEKVLEASGQDLSDPSVEMELPETLEYTIFVGEDDLPYRIVMDLMGTSMTMEFSDWGEDVAIEAPSADEISDVDPFSMTPAA